MAHISTYCAWIEVLIECLLYLWGQKVLLHSTQTTLTLAGANRIRQKFDKEMNMEFVTVTMLLLILGMTRTMTGMLVVTAVNVVVSIYRQKMTGRQISLLHTYKAVAAKSNWRVISKNWSQPAEQ